MSEINWERLEKETEEPEIRESILFERDDIGIKKENADDVYASLMSTYFDKETGADSHAFKDFYEENSDQYEGKSQQEVYEELSDKYEYLEEWLHRPDDEHEIGLEDYNEMRCAEDYGYGEDDSSLEDMETI